MSVRPAFQFYPADWRNNSKLRRCSEGARGAWMDILCILHDSDEYGILRWPLEDIARAAGVKLKYAQELAAKEVLKGGNEKVAAFVFTPFHAGSAGAAVTLIEASDGPLWYCSRFVKDEYIRQRRGAQTRFAVDHQSPPKSPPIPPIGDQLGDGPSSSTSSSKDTLSRESSSSTSSPPKKPRRSPDQGEPSGFNEFYQAYPRRVGRRHAAKAYRSALTRASPDTILTGACRYAAATIGKDREMVAHPATWLNGDRWLDEISPPASNGNGHTNGKQKPAAFDTFLRGSQRAVDLVCGPEDRPSESGAIIDITPPPRRSIS